jgi:thiol-disulfide isomerase/thioredoxin
MNISKRLIAAVLAIAIAAPIVALVGDVNMAQPTIPAGERTAFFHGLGGSPIGNQSALVSLERADAWLNSPPLTAPVLRGKVVLVHFWTYTCINWLRTQSYLRAWAEKYKDKGLVVIGVHTPEFRFEKKPRQCPPGDQDAPRRLSGRS